MCYVAQVSNWSETRWCAVKYSSRKMLRSEVCGMSHMVTMLQGNPDKANSYINGYARLTEAGRFYLCLAACNSQAPEVVHLELLKDNRFLRHVAASHQLMVDKIEFICNLARMVWQRLSAVVGGSRTWQQLRSECIRSAVISAGYLEMDVFRVVKESPWKYTQGDILQHV